MPLSRAYQVNMLRYNHCTKFDPGLYQPFELKVVQLGEILGMICKCTGQISISYNTHM